jgi:hypothetical protein
MALIQAQLREEALQMARHALRQQGKNPLRVSATTAYEAGCRWAREQCPPVAPAVQWYHAAPQQQRERQAFSDEWYSWQEKTKRALGMRTIRYV